MIKLLNTKDNSHVYISKGSASVLVGLRKVCTLLYYEHYESKNNNNINHDNNNDVDNREENEDEKAFERTKLVEMILKREEIF